MFKPNDSNPPALQPHQQALLNTKFSSGQAPTFKVAFEVMVAQNSKGDKRGYWNWPFTHPKTSLV